MRPHPGPVRLVVHRNRGRDGEVGADVPDPASGSGLGAVGRVRAEQRAGVFDEAGEELVGLVAVADDADVQKRCGYGGAHWSSLRVLVSVGLVAPEFTFA